MRMSHKLERDCTCSSQLILLAMWTLLEIRPWPSPCIGVHCSRLLCSRPDVCSSAEIGKSRFYHPRTQFNWRHMRTIMFDLEFHKYFFRTANNWISSLKLKQNNGIKMSNIWGDIFAIRLLSLVASLGICTCYNKKRVQIKIICNKFARIAWWHSQAKIL